MTSRGCPFSCAFFAAPFLNDRFEQRAPNDVVAEIAYCSDGFGTRNFAFYYDALLLKRENHIVPILEEVVRRKLQISFHTPNGLHIRGIDRDLALLLRRAGVRSLYLSQESTDEKVIREACPKVGEGDLEKAVGFLESAGYKRPDINVYLIAGLPNQDAASIKNSILFVRRLGARPRLAYFSPIPGTPIWRDLIDQGRIKKEADPLIHNKLVFPYFWADFSPQDYADVQDLLNE